MKLFVGFDIYNKNIQILQADKMAAEAPVEHLHYTERIFTKEFYDEARGLLADYFARKPTAKNLEAYVVLPNEAVGSEIINIPNMSFTKQLPAIEAELVNEYSDKRKGKKINRLQVMKTKQYTVFNLVYFDRNLIGDIYNLLTEAKLFPRMTTFCGNSLLNSVFAYMPRTRGKSFIFADIRLDYTLITVSSKGKNMGVATFRHGTDILKRDKVELEYMRTNHEAGEIAVINAREIARAKALTQAGEEEVIDPSIIPDDATFEDYAVEGAAEGEYSGAKAEAAVSVDEITESLDDELDELEEPVESAQTSENTETVENTETAGAVESAEGGENPESDEFFESEEDEAKRLAEIAAQKLKKVKTYRKMPKRYPKFMMREAPTTEEGFLYENFRIIQKWILSYARQAQLTEYIHDPEFILVNMPSELNWLLDRANEDQGEKGLQFRPFTAAEKLPPEIAGNLDLVGCMYAKQYNKHNNF